MLLPTVPVIPRRRLPSALVVVLVAFAALTLLAATGCSSDASTRVGASDAGPTTTAAPVSVPTTVPAGTTLRIGDQLDYLQTILALAGEDQDLGYEVEYAAFVGGPPMLQAFQGDSLDAGFVGSTPLIFAQAAGQDLVAVAGWGAENGAQGLVSADPDIDDWGDLAGKRVAYQRGTASEAALLQALDTAGVDPDEITTVDVPITQVAAALEGGSADAGLSTEPLTSLYLAGEPDGAEVAKAREITDRTSFLIATAETLADDGRSAALADYTARLVRAFAHLADHPEKVAASVYVEQYGLPPERAAEIVEANGPTSFISLPGDVEAQQQRLADLFLAAGQIPAEIDVSAQFDTRFNALVQEVQAG